MFSRSRRSIKLILFMVLFSIIVFQHENLYAEGFPAWKDEPIQDESKQLGDHSLLNSINEELLNAPIPIKVFILDEIAEEEEKFAKSAFEFYQLPSDQIFGVVDLSEERMAVVVGEDLAKLGLTPELIHNKIETYFTPEAGNGNPVSGVSFVIDQLLTELSEPAEDSNGAANHDATEPSSEEEANVTSENSGSWLRWMLILLVLLTALTLIAFWIRAKMLRRLIELEQWKEDLVQRWVEGEFEIDVAGNSPEVLIRAENLKQLYNDYLERVFPELMEEFVDGERSLRRFRFIIGKEILAYIEKTLQDAEAVLSQFHNEAEHIEEEKVEKPMDLEQTDRFLQRMHKRIEEISTQYGLRFSYLKERLRLFDKEIGKIQLQIENGEPINSSILDDIGRELQKIDHDLNQADRISSDLEEVIPTRIKELEGLYKAFHDHGDIENGQQVVQILKEVRDKWNSLITLWDEGKLQQLKEATEWIHSRLSEGERILKHEQIHRSEIMKNVTYFENRIQEILQVYEEDRKRLERLIKKYQLDEDPVMQLITEIEEQKKELNSNYERVMQLTERREYREAHQLSNNLPGEIESFNKRVTAFHERINTIAIEEDHYHKELKSLRNRLRLIRQHLDRSLLPGKHEQFHEMIEAGYKTILETEVLLDQKPLRLNKIALHMEQARSQVADAELNITRTIAAAQETEMIIRRINLFRNRVPQVGQLLMMAENCYRDQDYEEALTLAQKAEALLQKKRA